jgi:hypothetical protein
MSTSLPDLLNTSITPEAARVNKRSRNEISAPITLGVAAAFRHRRCLL